MDFHYSRRGFVAAAMAAGATLAAGRAGAQTAGEGVAAPETVRRNLAGFRSHRWQDHFDDLTNGVIIADTQSRAVHYWSEDGTVARIYPSSVPMSEELTRRGYTEVTRKVVGPSWAPTPSMRERDPSLPARVPPGPDNPLGSHALHLSWQYYRIHGTHDVRKIGRPSSNGCIGLYNENIAELFDLVQVGTKVRVI